MSSESLSTSSRSASIDSTRSPPAIIPASIPLRRIIYYIFPHFDDDEHSEVQSHRPAANDLSDAREPPMSMGLAENENCYKSRKELPRTTDHCNRPIVKDFGFADKPLPSPPLVDIIEHELEQNERGKMGRSNAQSLILMEGETIEEAQKILMPPPLNVGRKCAQNSVHRARSLGPLPEHNVDPNDQTRNQRQLMLSNHKQPGSVRKARLAAEARLAIAGCHSSSRHGPIRSTTSRPSLRSSSQLVWWSALASSPNEEAFVNPRRAPSPPTKKGSKYDFSDYTPSGLPNAGPTPPPPPRSVNRRRPTQQPQPKCEVDTASLAKEACTLDKARQLDPKDQSADTSCLPSNVARAPAAVVEALSATKCQDYAKASGSSDEADYRKNSGNGRIAREKLQDSRVGFAPRPCGLPQSSVDKSNPALSGGKPNISRTWNGVDRDSARVETILEENPSDSRQSEDPNPFPQHQPPRCVDDEETGDDNPIQDHLATEPTNLRRAPIPPPDNSILVTKQTAITHHHRPSWLRGGSGSERSKRSDSSTSTDSSGSSNGEATEQRSRFVLAIFTRLRLRTAAQSTVVASWRSDELRERRRVERDKSKGVGFWGTVFGVNARHKGRGEAEEDERVGREEWAGENAEEMDESEEAEEEQVDEDENEEEKVGDDGSANEETKGSGEG